jgi:hypothetical protein
MMHFLRRDCGAKKARPCEGVVRRVLNRPPVVTFRDTCAWPRSVFRTAFDIQNYLVVLTPALLPTRASGVK